MKIIRLSGEGLTLADLVAVSERRARVSLSPRARRAIRASRGVVDRAVRSGRTVYGVTTGFGALAHTRVDPSDASSLQHGIVRSHATAVGDPLTRE